MYMYVSLETLTHHPQFCVVWVDEVHVGLLILLAGVLYTFPCILFVL